MPKLVDSRSRQKPGSSYQSGNRHPK